MATTANIELKLEALNKICCTPVKVAFFYACVHEALMVKQQHFSPQTKCNNLLCAF